ncbi:MAG: signal peptidase I [Clostridia bacterium]|nr:signal peptidase I [Clostridia bacterium]
MNSFKKIWSIISTVIVVLAVILAVALAGVRLLGFQVYTVLSGSMEPTYHVGSLIYVKKVDPADVKVGDPITFVLNEDLVVATHRVVDIKTDDQGAIRFITKGDANDTADGGDGVHQNNLLGRPVFTIPYLGYLSSFIQHPPGTYLAIAVGAVLLLLVFLPDLLGAILSNDKGKNKKEEQEQKT